MSVKSHKDTLIVSACLLGIPCRYDGGSNTLPSEQIDKLRERYLLIPICPEQLGGLSTPRIPAEILPDGSVINKAGEDVTQAFERGAAAALAIARLNSCRLACMKDGSPSCGTRRIYDGTFGNISIAGKGRTVKSFEKEQIKVYNENEIERLTEENHHV